MLNAMSMQSQYFTSLLVKEVFSLSGDDLDCICLSAKMSLFWWVNFVNICTLLNFIQNDSDVEGAVSEE